MLAALWLVPAPASAQTRQQAPAQVLTWTANNSMTEYASAPETATSGPATIIFENSEATGNTTNMLHTLTFSTTRQGFNHDVDVNVTARPNDANGGRYEVQVNLSPGKYYYFCAIPGHTMSGVLVVEGDGGGDTTAPQVSAEVTGEQDADGAYVGSANVTLSATDDGSGVDTIEYEIDDTGFQPYSNPVTVDQPGDHTVQYRATDTAGNTSPVRSVSFTITEGPPGTDCPDSDTRPTVVIGTTDSEVPNRQVGNGCTINDLIREGRDWNSHGRFVNHVNKVAYDLLLNGVITEGERAALARTAVLSDVGRSR